MTRGRCLWQAEPLPVFIGFDPREEIAFDVCRFSLLRRASVPLHVQALHRAELQACGLYRRRVRYREDGHPVDAIDGRPFSTEFSFTRFLVPALCGYEGWALFVDCDFLFLADVAELCRHMDEDKAVMVCRQAHAPDERVKMDGCAQSRYRRKNWSSFMLLNCGHAAMRRLTVAAVNERPGSWLHGFEWLRDEEIGDLPHAWNWIAGTTAGAPKAVHYTAGGPWFPACTEVAFAREWRDEQALRAGGQGTEDGGQNDEARPHSVLCPPSTVHCAGGAA
jgi:hypothetical protein